MKAGMKLIPIFLFLAMMQMPHAQGQVECEQNSFQHESGLKVLMDVESQLDRIISIEQSACSRFLLRQYGLSVKNVCKIGNKLFACQSLTPPFGAELPESFFNDLSINKSDLGNSVTQICSKERANETQIAKNCALSDDPLFNQFTFGIFHICFCETVSTEPVLAMCAQNEKGNWFSTSEFDTSFVHNGLKKTCESAAEVSQKIACSCEMKFRQSSSELLDPC